MKQYTRFPVFLIFFSVVLLAQNARAQRPPTSPVTEMRGAWIATAFNIDWPSQPGLPIERQKMEFDSLLDVLKAMNMNAVFVQVRPSGDAMYRSPNVPWSKFLTGQQGVPPPDSTYDPMEYMIKAAHDRRMEFHAWLNPYRATLDLDTAALSPMHPLRSLPANRKAQWFFRYGRRYYFNPANPSVQQYLVNVVKDIVLRYDVDGIHFDDYFYPYKEAGETLNDYNEFASDPRGFSMIEDWRRDNISRLVSAVSTNIRKIKPYVRFGIGPFGVWRNRDRDPVMGSDTRAGVTCYDDLYADVLLWMKNGWIDYVAPQLYWSIGFVPADYEKLVDWWGKNTYGKQLYIGHAAYKINNAPNDINWTRPDEIKRQINLNRSNPNVNGSIFFSTRPLIRNPLGVQDSLINDLFKTQALVPPVVALSKIPPATPQICRIEGSPSSVRLAWNICDVIAAEQMPYYFAIYRFQGEAVGDFRNPRNLLATTAFNADAEKWTFEDQTAIEGEYYTYVITAFNRPNVQSYSSAPVFVKKTATTAKKKKRIFGYLF
ncbi:MAG TPA: family 10 glycosylhydrolase [Saprospiraceae bacterium]|nr:family 10 glycosylhydrolase [Saprospiraceae bacterium]HPI07731.1 family 10 glycosylhydrolase [Saprospiraceae bacterium]